MNFAYAGIERRIADVVVREFEFRSVRREPVSTPVHHAGCRSKTDHRRGRVRYCIICLASRPRQHPKSTTASYRDSGTWKIEWFKTRPATEHSVSLERSQAATEAHAESLGMRLLKRGNSAAVFYRLSEAEA